MFNFINDTRIPAGIISFILSITTDVFCIQERQKELLDSELAHASIGKLYVLTIIVFHAHS